MPRYVPDLLDDLVNNVVIPKDGQAVKKFVNNGVSIEALYREVFGI